MMRKAFKLKRPDWKEKFGSHFYEIKITEFWQSFSFSALNKKGKLEQKQLSNSFEAQQGNTFGGAALLRRIKAHYFLIILALLSGTATSIILTPSECVQCVSIFPDESFDFFGIPENLIFLSFAFHQSQWPSPKMFSSQTTTSETALSTILRC